MQAKVRFAEKRCPILLMTIESAGELLLHAHFQDCGGLANRYRFQSRTDYPKGWCWLMERSGQEQAGKTAGLRPGSRRPDHAVRRGEGAVGDRGGGDHGDGGGRWSRESLASDSSAASWVRNGTPAYLGRRRPAHTPDSNKLKLITLYIIYLYKNFSTKVKVRCGVRGRIGSRGRAQTRRSMFDRLILSKDYDCPGRYGPKPRPSGQRDSSATYGIFEHSQCTSRISHHQGFE